MESNNHHVWEAAAQISRDILDKSIPKHWLLDEAKLPGKEVLNVGLVAEDSGILSAEEIKITRQNATSLLYHYRNGLWTVEQVVTAFMKRATIGHQLLNFATEFLVDDALETARSLDKHFQTTGSLKGPLHGIPISVKSPPLKEHVAIAGRICNASFVSKILNVPTEDAHIVKLIRAAGAVIHVRTNQPQSIMHLDCNNNITGLTLNPCNHLMSPGGSSGGEGASLGFRCSVLGIGTDIGGSIRVPASFCNAYGFKPTALRNPSLGLAGVMAGQESIRGCVGPLSNDIDDLILFEKAILSQQPWETETSLVPLGWRDTQILKDDITVGIMFDDGVVHPHPPVLRALREVEKQLQSKGVKTVRWYPLQHLEMEQLLRKLYLADSGESIRTALNASGEPVLPLTNHMLDMAPSEPFTIKDNWAMNFKREAFRRDYHARMKAEGVDVILCPAYVGAGALQGHPKYWLYTSIWNLLDQPAITFPSGFYANKEIDIPEVNYVPRSQEDRREWEAYDSELFDGLPISIQLVGKHHRDEELLETAKILEDALRS